MTYSPWTYWPIYANHNSTMRNDLCTIARFVLKKQRALLKISQEDLADRCQLDRTYISGFERGVRNISLNSLDKIIHGLGLTYEDFFNLCLQDFEENK
ncbi:MAG: helix-turn-helix protein [Firmicutes bacterium ADurb.Bin080]|nr:MAG: helix-turn-helix protein [Firmicutes bacterium ADurb.Bin080]